MWDSSEPPVDYSPERPPKYSVVVPFHNEQGSVRELHRRISVVMAERPGPVEFIYVDDQSRDATPQLLAEIAAEDPRVTVLRLRRNYGQTTALAAGFDCAAGDIVVAMDGDLQHDPADIPAMLDTFATGDYDIVSGWRQKRVDSFLMRRLPSRVANWMMAKLSGVDIHDFGSTFKVYRRETIKDVRLYGEMHRFIPALAAWNGARIVEVPIRNVERPGGKSHYGLSRTLRVLFDIITVRFLMRYMTRPLHFFGPPGLIGIFSGSAILLSLFVEKIFSHGPIFVEHGPLLILGMMLCLFGVQLLAVGLVGELLMRTHFDSGADPVYRIERVIRSSAAGASPAPVASPVTAKNAAR
ncbi:MAG TPA: glycosyltransferase family 2 protein [Candidatus Acidoferrales bacterium]|nr:glycosyltransferase family 2 protein [Candidatus Acidoferrales bacterium]